MQTVNPNSVVKQVTGNYLAQVFTAFGGFYGRTSLMSYLSSSNSKLSIVVPLKFKRSSKVVPLLKFRPVLGAWQV